MGKVVFDKLLGKPLLHVHDPLYLTDADDVLWKITIDTDGTLIIELANPEPAQGSPFGPWIWMTYP